MRKSLLLATVAASAWLLVAEQPAQAQYGQSTQQPYNPRARSNLSPYLNLLRGGDPAANYYLGVVPEFRYCAINRTVSTAILDLETQQPAPHTGNADLDELLPEVPDTGHATAFMNLGGYYNFGGGRTVAPTPRQAAAKKPKTHK